MRSLSGSGAKLGQPEAIELAVVNERRLGPRPDHHLEGLLHPLAAVVAPQSVADELVLVEIGPVADADVEPAAREVVEERQLGRQADRMAQGELEHGEPDTDPRRTGGHDAGERNRIAVDALAREVVLGEPEPVEAHGLGEARLGDQLVDRAVVRFRGPGVGERQPAELHRSSVPATAYRARRWEKAISSLVTNSSSTACPFSFAFWARCSAGTMSAGFATRSAWPPIARPMSA